MVEFSAQVDKKCASYKNEITSGLSAALIAWSYQRMVHLVLQDCQLHGIQTSSSERALNSTGLALAQLASYHERTRGNWVRAVSLVPSLAKYGFCIYSPIEDLVKTVDRYI